jgi:glutamine synthetase
MHQSIWRGEKPLFAGDSYGGLSELAMHYIAGILAHASALCAIVGQLANSYRRLVPGFEAACEFGVLKPETARLRCIPMYSPSPKAKRIEVRFPDPLQQRVSRLCRIAYGRSRRYRAKTQSRRPLDKDIYSLTPEELANVPSFQGH